MTITVSTDSLASYRTGVGLVFLAKLAWSLSGVFTRLLTTDVWTAIAWRSFFGGLFLLIPYIAINRQRSFAVLLSIGRPGLLLAACQVICQACTVGALYYTSVANVTVIYATAPFIAAVLAWWLFNEVIQTKTIIAALVSMLGVIIIVIGSFSGGPIIGDVLAIGMTISFAFIIVIPRAKRDLPMMPTTILSAFVTMALFAPFGSASQLDAHNWLTLAGFGLTNFTIALFLFLLGARAIPSAIAALIGTLEIIMAPLWVWWLFAEQPDNAALLGGAIIFSAVIWHIVKDLRSPRPVVAAN